MKSEELLNEALISRGELLELKKTMEVDSKLTKLKLLNIENRKEVRLEDILLVEGLIDISNICEGDVESFILDSCEEKLNKLKKEIKYANKL